MDEVVVVDDRADTLEGRVTWLSRVPAVCVRGLSFREALDPGTDWSTVTLAVLDGRDDRLEDWIDLPQPDGTARPVPDRYLGVRVAERIRAVRNPGQTRIVLISAYARDNEILARRCQQAGVDYLYSVHELHDAQAFYDRVLRPDASAAPERLIAGTRWQQWGLDGAPDLSGAIAAAEASPAGAQVVFDLPAKQFPGLGHQQRRLRETLGRTLGLHGRLAGGDRQTHPGKRAISQWLRRALGYTER